MIIEAIAARPYSEEIKRRILRPLDLRRTLAPNEGEQLPEPHARGYLAVNGRLIDITAFNTSQAWAAGGMVSTAEGVSRFYAALLTGALLNPAELQAMQTTLPTNRPEVRGGLGLGQWTVAAHAFWGYTGGIFGYNTWSYHTPDAKHQLTVSATSGFTSPATALDILSGMFNLEKP